MHGDPRFGRFFTYLNLFVASMLILVLANNFAVLFVGWELVGLCSYLLISFWFEKETAAAAGKKAFIVNRVGDFGFIVALMLVFAHFGTFRFDEVLAGAGGLAAGTATAIGLLLLVGAAGKSAQLPLYVWLPDAMEGPTPVSALIHAATMVTAGVYLVARTAPIYGASEVAGAVVAIVGTATALFAATIALAQNDIKRVLAYSTISQLGFMFMAVGAAAHVAGIFHLMTHAFFKALLFLGAGSVIHGMHGEQDMNRMGGLARKMPATFFTMAIGWLAISGIPPLAGFWSKDEIWAASSARRLWVVLFAVGLLTAAITAFYMTRMMWLTFFGTPRWAEGLHPHESPKVMTVPLVALAGLSGSRRPGEYPVPDGPRALPRSRLRVGAPRPPARGIAGVDPGSRLGGGGPRRHRPGCGSLPHLSHRGRSHLAHPRPRLLHRRRVRPGVRPHREVGGGMARLSLRCPHRRRRRRRDRGLVRRIGGWLRPLQTGFVRSHLRDRARRSRPPGLVPVAVDCERQLAIGDWRLAEAAHLSRRLLAGSG
jgi:formate hydrogenlyase subunit 3/multisubunit Na+/H+ antiporter MnhD subunit